MSESIPHGVYIAMQLLRPPRLDFGDLHEVHVRRSPLNRELHGMVLRDCARHRPQHKLENIGLDGEVSALAATELGKDPHRFLSNI